MKFVTVSRSRDIPERFTTIRQQSNNKMGPINMRYSMLKASAVAGLLLGSLAGAHAATVTNLTPITPVANSTSTSALAINDNGIIAGGWIDSNNIEHAFYGPPDGSNYTSFDYGDPGNNGYGTEARAINNKSIITGYFSSSTLNCSTATCEFERNAAGKIDVITMSGTPLIGIPGGIVSSGNFVGGYYNPANNYASESYYGKNHAYISDITLPIEGAEPRGRGLSESGEVVGFYYTQNSNVASGFVLQGDTVTTFNDPHPNAVNGTILEGVNKNGVIVGFWNDKVGNPHAFALSADLSTIFEIKIPNSTYSQSFGINSSNRIVVTSDVGTFIYCDSRLHPVPKCTPASNSVNAVAEAIHVPAGAIAQYNCRGDCITYRLASSATSKHATAAQVRAFATHRPGILLP
jgi:uncharacterized membrane protein